MSRLALMIEGCKAHGLDFAEWRRRRQFLSNDVVFDGRFLDLGCGSGFLIACLAVWSKRRLEPFGIDRDQAAIDLARDYFCSHRSNFLCADLRSHEAANFCSEGFDYVFWNAPGSWGSDECGAFILSKLPHVTPGGRFILALYGEGKPASCGRLLEERLGMTRRLGAINEACGDRIATYRWSGPDTNQVAAIVDHQILPAAK